MLGPNHRAPAMDGRFEVRYDKVTECRSPKTTIVITVSRRTLLSFRTLAGEALYSEIPMPPPTPLARIGRTFPLDIRSILDRPSAHTRLMLITAFSDLGRIQTEEDMMLRLRHLSIFLQHEASKVKMIEGYVVDAVVHYHYFVRRQKMAVLDEEAVAQVTPADAHVQHWLSHRVVPFVGKEPTMRTCWLCFLDFENGALVCQLQCHHRFHPRCLESWNKMNNLCPLCLDRPLAQVAGSSAMKGGQPATP